MDTYLIFNPADAPEAYMAKNAIEARDIYTSIGKAAQVHRVTTGYPSIDVTADFYEECYGEEYEEPRPFKFRVVGGAVERRS